MRLYQLDSYATRFQARVERSWTDEKPKAILSETLFYPTSGGQPHDTGWLSWEGGKVRVLEVYEEEKAKGAVVHVLEKPIPEGTEVEGEIDWSRRYRHMQRHTAQHILSQAFLRAGGFHTVAVSLDSPQSTVDFAEPPDEEVVRKAEALANFAVYANHPVRAFEVAEEELPRYPLRRPPKAKGRIRLVEIGTFDLAACGGTHLRSSAEAGPIKVLKVEAHKGGSRVYFTAGWEALEDYAQKHTLLQRLALKYSTQALEVEKPIAKLEEEIHALKGEVQALKRALVETLLPQALEKGRLLVPESLLQDLAKALLESGRAALLLSESGRFALVGPEKEKTFKELQVLGAKGGGREIMSGILPKEKISHVLEGKDV